MKRTGTRVLAQRKDWDCGVTAIAMFLDVAYGDVAKAVRDRIDDPRLKQRGLLLWQIEVVIEAMGHRTRRIYRSKDYLNGQTGVLGLNGGHCAPHGHWVLYRCGVVIDPSGGEVWTLDDYLKAGRCRPATIVVKK